MSTQVVCLLWSSQLIFFRATMSFRFLICNRHLPSWKLSFPVTTRFMASDSKRTSANPLSYPGKPTHSSSYQAIVIGGGNNYYLFWKSVTALHSYFIISGHNGLVAANYLLRAGFKKICVLERRHVVGDLLSNLYRHAKYYSIFVWIFKGGAAGKWIWSFLSCKS